MSQDNDELSYAIRPLGNTLFPTHALCPACNEIKPIKQFKTKSTNAQAISWGYKRAIEITTEKCVKCRAPRKKIKDMTLKEIHNKIMTGDIKGGAYGNMIKEDREADGRRRKREGVINRWKGIRFDAWTVLIEQAEKEYARIRKQLHIKTNEDADSYAQLLNFLKEYNATIKQVKTFLTQRRKQGTETAMKGVAWTYYINKGVKEKLIKLWQEIPPDHKAHLTPPTVLLNQLTNNTEKE